MNPAQSQSQLQVITGPLAAPVSGAARIALSVDRQTLAKRRWRAAARDGREFGFDLERPLRHGDAFFAEGGAVYHIDQKPEPVLAVLVVTPAQAARTAWQIGNLHFPAAVTEDNILAEDDPALRQMFERERISYRVAEAVFQPISAAAGGHHHHHSH